MRLGYSLMVLFAKERIMLSRFYKSEVYLSETEDEVDLLLAIWDLI